MRSPLTPPLRPFVRLPFRRALVLFTLAACTLQSAPARASDEAAAEALFVEAKKLAAEGKLAEACPKFAESNRLDRGAGTLIHLADCYEKNHQSASAWATFKEAASAAQALGRAEWQKLASQRAAFLEPRLARLTIKIQDPADAIDVRRDGAPASPASWGSPIPVDVGTHTVEASAPMREPFKTTIKIVNDGDRVEVTVPRLREISAPAAVASKTAPPNPKDGGSQRTVGFIVGGVGVAGIAVGAITGIVAIGKNSDSKENCPTDGPCANTDAVAANESAKTFGVVSTVAFIAGGVALAAGAILIFSAPSSSRPSARSARASSVRIVPASDGRSANLSIMGVF